MIKSLNLIIQTLFDHSKDISSSGICFSPEVRKLCEQNACGCFGKYWTCPPAVGSIEDLKGRLSKFNRFIIVDKVYALEDSFDWEGMKDGVKNFQYRLLKLKKEIRQKDPGFDFILLGAGACQLCPTCTRAQNKPCRNPEDALIAIEAYGIDAMKLMKDNGLKYNNGPNTVTYIGAILYQG